MALINVDMQNCFVEDSPLAAPGGRALLDRVNRLTKACRAAGVQIIHTAHVVRPDGSNVGVMGEIIKPVGDGYLNRDRKSSHLHPKLDTQAEDIILDKPRYGSFHATDLELILRSKGVDTIIVSGICTNICCDTTAREASMRDFHVFFLSDGTATFPIGDVSAEDIQRVSCATLGMAFAQIVTVDEMIGKLAAARAADGWTSRIESRNR
jgi:ureidoacrylate peracid hydrolase